MSEDNKNKKIDDLLKNWENKLENREEEIIKSRAKTVEKNIIRKDKLEILKNRISEKINTTNKILSKYSVQFTDPKTDNLSEVTWAIKIDKVSVFFTCVDTGFPKKTYSYVSYDPDNAENIKLEYDPDNKKNIAKLEEEEKWEELDLRPHDENYSKHIDKINLDDDFLYEGEESYEDILEIFLQEFETYILVNKIDKK